MWSGLLCVEAQQVWLTGAPLARSLPLCTGGARGAHGAAAWNPFQQLSPAGDFGLLPSPDACSADTGECTRDREGGSWVGVREGRSVCGMDREEKCSDSIC